MAFIVAALPSPRTTRGGDEPRRLPRREDDAAHCYRNSRRYRRAGSHGIRSGEGVACSEGSLAPQRPKSNILLITFDALSAEDMSLYGYKLPTTPNIGAFARKSTVFNSFYSASTFTTPCVATMLTGMYPSETKVYQLEGLFARQRILVGSLPESMRAGGYATGAFFSNPYAYYLGQAP